MLQKQLAKELCNQETCEAEKSWTYARAAGTLSLVSL